MNAPWWLRILTFATLVIMYAAGYYVGRRDGLRDCAPPIAWGYVEQQQALDRLERRMVQAQKSVAYWKSWRDFTEYRAKRRAQVQP